MSNNCMQTAKERIINIFTWILNMLNIFKQSAIKVLLEHFVLIIGSAQLCPRRLSTVVWRWLSFFGKDSCQGVLLDLQCVFTIPKRLAGVGDSSNFSVIKWTYLLVNFLKIWVTRLEMYKVSFSNNLFNLNQEDILMSSVLIINFSVLRFLCLIKKLVSSAKSDIFS